MISGGKADVGNGEFLAHPAALSWRTTNLRLRDVCAGIAILEEAGGLVTTANPPAQPETAPIEPAKLGGRLYLAVR